MPNTAFNPTASPLANPRVNLGVRRLAEHSMFLEGGYFANVIESPSPADLAVGRSEGKMLTSALELIGLPHRYSLVQNYSEFMDALGRQTTEGSTEFSRLPVIHLSMHGSPDGLALTDGKFLSWADLNWKFRMINRKVQQLLIVCLSSCYGLSGLRMIRGETAHDILEHEPPFRLLVSNTTAVPWSDAAIAFAAFYHHLERGSDFFGIINAVRVASGNDNFFGLLAGDSVSQPVSVLGAEALRKAIDAVA